jgi:hypothetical protein
LRRPMIEVSIEVREGNAPFRVAVRAESISQAVSNVKERHPGGDVRVVFPIDPESFFPGGGRPRPLRVASMTS